MQRYFGSPWAVVWIVLLAFHTVGLFSYPRVEADEGGWPLSVRAWVETGTLTRDYYMAPGYHWLLGAPFRLFGARYAVARPASVVVGLAALWLFHRLARRVGGREAAHWALWLAGTSYGVLMMHRRALMEPWQVLLMVALAVSVVERPGPRWLWRPLAIVLTALLLVTKASGVFLLPALVLAAAWPGEPAAGDALLLPWWRRAWSVAWVLGAGVALAAGVFGSLYLNDPAAFVASWTADLTVARTADGGHAPGAGRFVLDWEPTWLTLRRLVWLEPVLAVLAAFQIWRTARGGALRMPGSLLGWWLAGGFAFLGLQRSVAEQHRLVLMLPLCFLAAQQLAAWSSSDGPRAWWKQPRFWLAAAMVLSATRMAVGTWRLPDEQTAVTWLARETRGQFRQRVLAAPYVLMQLDPRPLSFFTLPPPHLPELAVLQRHGVDWVVIDQREWRHHARLGGASPETVEATLHDCCLLAYDTPMTRVYRVRRQGETE